MKQQLFGDFKANARAAAGDECHFAIQTIGRKDAAAAASVARIWTFGHGGGVYIAVV